MGYKVETTNMLGLARIGLKTLALMIMDHLWEYPRDVFHETYSQEDDVF